jgi:hypothetical protein
MYPGATTLTIVMHKKILLETNWEESNYFLDSSFAGSRRFICSAALH